MENEKPFAKDWSGNNVFMAESDEIKKAGSNVDRLLELIAPFMGWKDISHVLVTDMSELGDFGLKDEQIAVLCRELGFTVKAEDYIYEIAARM